MAFSLGALTAYTEQNKFPLITKTVFGAKTISMISIQTGISSSAEINIMETDALFQVGGTCGFSPSGNTSLSQRKITVGDIKVHEPLCPKTLKKFWVQTQMKAGTANDEIPFEELYTDKKIALINAALETAVWQGDTGSGNNQLNKFDGFIKLIEAASPVFATAQASISASTVRGIYKDIFEKIPVALLGKTDVVSFCGWDTFRILVNKLTDDNLFHYTTDADAQTGEMFYPGTSVKIVAVHGLNGTNRIVTGQLGNFYYGTDMENEEERFELFFAKEADELRFMVEWKSGVQVAFPDQIVVYKNS